MKRYAALALACALFVPAHALAWGARGHTMINLLAAQSFPTEMPAFTRTVSAIEEIATLGPEEDRLKGAGGSWDADNDPGHYLNLGDDGTIDGVSLQALPESMSAYAIALEAAHTTPWRAGYLPYSIIDGFEQLREDFAYWRVDVYGAQHAGDAGLRARFAEDEALRETLTLRDLGVWGHFVGDACQPLHVTVHFNGWGNYPNPRGYTEAHIHSRFESDFVDRFITADIVRTHVPLSTQPLPAHLLSQSEIAAMVAAYLEGTSSAVAPLYDLENEHGFDGGSPAAVDFTVHQLARGVAELRDLSDLAWLDSLYAPVGYPANSVQDIVNGRVPLSASLLGTV